MRRSGWFIGVTVCAGLLTGCVDRRFVITSDPPGALVLRNGQPIGASPADDHFVYYGDEDFTLIKDGYETLHVKQKVPAPWYEYFGLDFVSENFWPFQIKDVRRFHYQMVPLQAVRSDELLHQAEVLRERGRMIQPLPNTSQKPNAKSPEGSVPPPPEGSAPPSPVLPPPTPVPPPSQQMPYSRP